MTQWKVGTTVKTHNAPTRFWETYVHSEIVGMVGRSSGASEEEAKEIARMFAAAPELLEGLKGVVAVADRNTDEFDRARAAIAKAEGAA